MKHVAIIGGGMAGAAAAAQITSAGLQPVVFDKGRSVGGRMSARRAAVGLFDHGTQFLPTGGAAWTAFLRSHGSTIVPWHYRISGSEGHRSHLVTAGPFRDLLAPLLDGAHVECGVTVRSLSPVGQSWTIEATDDRSWSDFAAVILTAPAPQTVALAGGHSSEIASARHVAFDPVWCAMVAFEMPILPEADILEALPDIAWAARMNSKPGRGNGADRWVLHASPAWSVANLEMEKPTAASVLVARFSSHCAISQPSIHLEGHRWRFARARQPFGAPCLVDRGRRLIAAGDWCLGDNLADAFESGSAAGRAAAALLA